MVVAAAVVLGLSDGDDGATEGVVSDVGCAALAAVAVDGGCIWPGASNCESVEAISSEDSSLLFVDDAVGSVAGGMNGGGLNGRGVVDGCVVEVGTVATVL